MAALLKHLDRISFVATRLLDVDVQGCCDMDVSLIETSKRHTYQHSSPGHILCTDWPGLCTVLAQAPDALDPQTWPFHETKS